MHLFKDLEEHKYLPRICKTDLFLYQVYNFELKLRTVWWNKFNFNVYTIKVLPETQMILNHSNY